MGRPEADTGRLTPGGGGMGRPEAETGRGAPGAGAAPGPGRPGAAGGRGAPPWGGGPAGRCGACGAADAAGRCGGMPWGSGRAATDDGRCSLVIGRELTTRRGSSAGGAAGAAGSAAAAGATGAAGAAGAASAAGAGAGAGAGVGASAAGATGAGSTAGAGAGAGSGAGAGAGATTSATGAGAAGAASESAGASDESTRLAPLAFLAGASPSGLAAAFFAAVFLAGLASSGCSGRVSPSRSARRRNRSAWASMIDEDWLLASTPITLHRSSTSVLVIPSSFASSCTRMFFAKLIQPFVGVGPSEALPAAFHSLMCDGVDSNAIRSSDSAPGPTGRRHARSKPRRFTAAVKHPGVSLVHSHAPRPGAVRLMIAVPS